METEKKTHISAIAREAFKQAFETLQAAAFRIALDKGWLPLNTEPNHAEQIALMHAELSEAIEYLREGNGSASEKIPDFNGLEEELADVIIRIMSYAGRTNLRVGGAVVAKMLYNAERPYKHGGKAF